MLSLTAVGLERVRLDTDFPLSRVEQRRQRNHKLIKAAGLMINSELVARERLFGGIDFHATTKDAKEGKIINKI